MLTVTFDSNVIEKILMPELHETEEKSPFFFRIRKAIDQKQISVCVADMYFTREQIPKTERLLRTNKNITNASEIKREVLPNGRIRLCISIGPSKQFGNVELDHFRRKTLGALQSVGGKILKTFRLADFVCKEIPSELYCHPESVEGTMCRIDKCFRYVEEQLSAGGDAIRMVTGAGAHENPYLKLSDPKIQGKAFSTAFAEDADAMAIAAHYGYGIQLFCTEDKGVSAGLKSVMSQKNRLKLRKQFGIRFCNVRSLTKLVEMFRRKYAGMALTDVGLTK